MKSYIHQIRDYYCACDSDYDDDDDNQCNFPFSKPCASEIFRQTFQAVFVLLFNYQVNFFLPGKGREKLHDFHYLEAIPSSLLLHLQGWHSSLEKSLNFRASP